MLELSRLADGGDSRAAYFIGRRYATGDGVTRDMGEAVRWFKRAAEDDLPEAQHWLGMMYAKGRGVDLDHARAAGWFELAAKQDLPEAQHALGTMLLKGQGVARDDAKAARWLLKAAELGLPRAQYNLGVLYEFGRGVTLSLSQAKARYQQAADAGFEPAGVRLREFGARVAAAEQGKAPHKPRKPKKASRTAATQLIDAVQALEGLADKDYTVQLVSYRSLKRAEGAVTRFRLGADARIYTSQSRGRVWFVIIYGKFSQKAQAEAAITELPRSLRKAKPRVRQVGAIRRQLARQAG